MLPRYHRCPICLHTVGRHCGRHCEPYTNRVGLGEGLQTSAKADKDAPTIHHGPGYVSLETFQKFASDVLKSLKRLEDSAAAKKK